MTSARSDADTTVLLLNFGGPDTGEDVGPFLYRLFACPEVIPLPAPLRVPLAWALARARRRESREMYEKIGGGSPLRKHTEQQARAIAAELRRRGRGDVAVRIGMQCSEPSIAVAVGEVVRESPRVVVVLPLFPQYSVTTTGACYRLFEKAWRQQRRGARPALRRIREWPTAPGYVATLVELIRSTLAQVPAPRRDAAHVLFSAHSVPKRIIDAGDPYLGQIKQTVAAVYSALGIPNRHSLSFQSKVGPVEWLAPSTDVAIADLGRAGCRDLVVVPISFVSEHLETLYEIDMLYRGQAVAAGIDGFYRAPAPNAHPVFISGISDLIVAELDAGLD
ncbi:MAG: ferrochelatase [Candidatus Schekmanbacteria bacterium]|nr:ferrochelatase [Candidatus Schekmanbacteria bacterium]